MLSEQPIFCGTRLGQDAQQTLTGQWLIMLWPTGLMAYSYGHYLGADLEDISANS